MRCTASATAPPVVMITSKKSSTTRRTWRPSGICRLYMYRNRSMRLEQTGGGTLSVEDVLSGSRVGVAVAAEVSVICDGSTAISLESPAARTVSIASASARSMARPHLRWTWITRPTYRTGSSLESTCGRLLTPGMAGVRFRMPDANSEWVSGMDTHRLPLSGPDREPMCPMSVPVMLRDRARVREWYAPPSHCSAHRFQSMTLT